jgi:tetratricopeptide (TPR) repeat protein
LVLGGEGIQEDLSPAAWIVINPWTDVEFSIPPRVAAAEEAVGIYRKLAAARPDAFRPDLAALLHNLSLQLADLGRREDALAAAEEAVGIYRKLAAARPDAFRPDLAGSLTNLSAYLGELGRPEDALTAAEEAVTIYQELAARSPDAYRQEVEHSLQVVARLEVGGDLNDESPQEPK